MAKNNKALMMMLISLLALTSLYFYMWTVVPLDMAPGDVGPSNEGKWVKVEGIVNDPVFYEKNAGFSIVDLQNGEALNVHCTFSPSIPVKANLQPGTKVEAVGDISSYKGEPELVVKAGRDLRIIAPPEANEVRMGAIFQERSSFENMTVSVQGVVLDLDKSWGDLTFTLQSGAIKAMVRVKGFSAQIPFEDGSNVRVIGRIGFDDNGLLRISCLNWKTVTVV